MLTSPHLALNRDSEEESQREKEEQRRCRLEWDREREKLSHACESAQQALADLQLREHKRERERERERARESERAAALQEASSAEQALRAGTKQSLVCSIERTLIKDAQDRNALLVPLAFATWNVQSLRSAIMRLRLLAAQELAARQAAVEATEKERVSCLNQLEAAAGTREKERAQATAAREEEKAASSVAMQMLRQEAAAAVEAERACWVEERERERERAAWALSQAQEEAEAQRQMQESAIAELTAQLEAARAQQRATEEQLRGSEKRIQQLEPALALSEAAARQAAAEAARAAESVAAKQARQTERALKMDIRTTRQQLLHSSLHVRPSPQGGASGMGGGGLKGEGSVVWRVSDALSPLPRAGLAGTAQGSHCQTHLASVLRASGESVQMVRTARSPSVSISLASPAPCSSLSLLRLSAAKGAGGTPVGGRREEGGGDLSAVSVRSQEGAGGGISGGSLWEKRMRSLALARGLPSPVLCVSCHRVCVCSRARVCARARPCTDTHMCGHVWLRAWTLYTST